MCSYLKLKKKYLSSIKRPSNTYNSYYLYKSYIVTSQIYVLNYFRLFVKRFLNLLNKSFTTNLPRQMLTEKFIDNARGMLSAESEIYTR